MLLFAPGCGETCYSAAALAELQNAAAFYVEEANVELGESFVAEFEHSISVLLEHPLIGMV